ncbi:glycosyl transferase family 2 [mine drainage metagenome]|uniref:Glycosyl transferase family 2 n=1 Tax=mine drainage metagenome TaxID=410659 RepID=A0A1J5RW19_9ZZZZ
MDISRVGVVIIGRNEGERLVRCLKFFVAQPARLVYVDSGSTDGSINVASNMGADVIALDLTVPFTAARARNVGFERMKINYPQVEYIQFLDGDCELIVGWLETAVAFLDEHKDVAMVCGRLRERYPDRSIYNLLCDIEWDTEVGLAKACGGIALVRLEAFEAERGYRADLIAGEESELCVRLRASGRRIWRLDAEMALHDAAMTHFWQWWKRSRRAGYAYAEGMHLHGFSPEMHRVRESQRIWIWGLGIPVLVVSLTNWLGIFGLAMLLIYPAQIVRIALRGTRTVKKNWLHALFLVLGKFPEVIGQLNYFYNRLTGKAAHLIEYK